MLHNRNILSLIERNATGGMAIDAEYALSQINAYLEQIELLSMGAPYSELGLSDKRSASFPSLITINNGELAESPFSEINTTKGTVALLRLSGVMRAEDGASSRGVQSFTDDLRAADASPNVSGIIIEINSGGGEAMAGQMAMNAVAEVRKPVVVIGHTVGSAAYMAAMKADQVFAAGRDSCFGSIGSFISLPLRFASWYKENYEDLYADVSGDKNHAFREWLNGNSEPFRKIVNEGARNFQADVLDSRRLRGGEKKAAETLSGGMFFAGDALNRGLIDGYSTVRQAAELLTNSAGMTRQQFANHNQEDMSFKEKVLALIGQEPEVKAEEPKEEPQTEERDEVRDIAEGNQQALAGLQASVADLQSAVQALAENQKAIAETVKSVQESVAEQMKAVTETLDAIKTNLSDTAKSVAEIKGIKPGNRTDEPDLTTVEKAFSQKHGKVVVPGGQSKF